ncbi:MAG TPA: SPOR domain-containing protein [Blastocatellia bacterium]|nr:SPOR domain-containing protein [Blastocatellia bacterium]
MQVETLTRICPLCRRPADSEALPPTRLCRDCRTMLAPISPRAGVVQADYVVTRPAAPTLQATAVAPAVAEADFDDVVLAPAAVSQPFAAHDETPRAPEVFIAPDQYEDGDAFIAADRIVDHEISAPPHAAEESAAAAETTGALSADEPLAEFLPPVLESHAAHTEAPADDLDLGPEFAETQPAAEAVASADPWDDPLPADEYSHREWPMLAKDERPSLISRLKWPLVALLVIGVAAAAYFVFSKRHGESPAASTQQPLTVPVAPLPAAPPTGPATATSPAPASEKKETPPASATQAIDSQSKHTLQVMASPNEAEANSMAERLKSAGLPAYVVRADLGSRGTYYRVRIGGFATHEEAQRFAAEARSRAAAAGIQLKELPVTAYDKP